MKNICSTCQILMNISGWIFIWSENVNSDVKLKTLYSFESQSNQNDLTHVVDLLVQFSIIWESVLSKVVNDRFKEFGKTEFQNIENWMSSLS